MFQDFPKEFPLEREKTTVTELAKFIAKAAFFEQPRPSAGMAWTDAVPQTLQSLLQNSTLKAHAPDLVEIIERLESQVHLLHTFPKVLTHRDFSQVNIVVNDARNLTGAIDFDEAGVEAFGMCIWGLYECFFGSMEDGKWDFYDERPILEKVFWDTLWENTPEGLRRENAETGVKVALSIGVINRYFVAGMIDEIDLSKKVHRLSLEYARGILPAACV